ncbi:tryptophan halogenase family protein [Gilvimarinus sp. DA14]|uniref:tryptophan halogenase family protein n=1 Tax=Gilvimarinus sp. DA14 TaxID=2956798 RepID=UPI0020B7CC81|nr:tryptophan halogenase family protein [Gilvimarinus sp. DA14]UTF61458.1 tryptophan 7-halogenase [Gilvimarinus sp. DA14]
MGKSQKPKTLLIVGGGTSGWMAATLMASRWPDINVRLLESDNIGTVGVGEGSTPHLKIFFDTLGIAESEWMPRCNATYKNGIYFSNWSSVPGFERYFHPFPAQTDDLTMPMFFKHIQARRLGRSETPHPDQYFLESYLTRNNLGPIAAECFPFNVAYGYHFDAALLGKFLAAKAEFLGVERIEGNVAQVQLNEMGEISRLRLDDSRTVQADFFIDCTGFKSLLLQDALQVPFTSYRDNLFNDAAVVLPTDAALEITPATDSTALSNGWAWRIPLRNRCGNGYVYSSAHLSADQAETELRQHLGLQDAEVSARHLQMKVGVVQQHWRHNCVAVGLAQGFIEPLEATALALTFNTIMQFIKRFEDGDFSGRYQDDFNREIGAKFSGIRDYIVCHYKVNQRTDTAYWRDNAANNALSESLQAVLHLWRHSDNFAADMRKYNLEGSYQAKSWACLLAGYGLFPALDAKASAAPDNGRGELTELAEFIRRCGLNFTNHNQLLAAHGVT